MLRYFAFAISLGMAVSLWQVPTLAAPVDCFSRCDGLTSSSLTDDGRDDCERLIEEAGNRCSTFVDPSQDGPRRQEPRHVSFGDKPIRHPAPGRIVPDASFFGLY
jgi:hypothetical protein